MANSEKWRDFYGYIVLDLQLVALFEISCNTEYHIDTYIKRPKSPCFERNDNLKIVILLSRDRIKVFLLFE